MKFPKLPKESNIFRYLETLLIYAIPTYITILVAIALTWLLFDVRLI